MKTDPNTPAFARGTDNPNLIGLTKREYFAGVALQGLLATGGEESLCVRRAVRVADELIAEFGRSADKEAKGPLNLNVVRLADEMPAATK